MGSRNMDRYVYTMLTEALLAVIKGQGLSVGPSVEEFVGQVWSMGADKSWSMRTEKSCAPLTVKEIHARKYIVRDFSVTLFHRKLQPKILKVRLV